MTCWIKNSPKWTFIQTLCWFTHFCQNLNFARLFTVNARILVKKVPVFCLYFARLLPVFSQIWAPRKNLVHCYIFQSVLWKYTVDSKFLPFWSTLWRGLTNFVKNITAYQLYASCSGNLPALWDYLTLVRRQRQAAGMCIVSQLWVNWAMQDQWTWGLY